MKNLQHIICSAVNNKVGTNNGLETNHFHITLIYQSNMEIFRTYIL